MSLERTVHAFELGDFHFQTKEGRSHHLSTLQRGAVRGRGADRADGVPDTHTAMCAVCIQENCRLLLTPTF